MDAEIDNFIKNNTKKQSKKKTTKKNTKKNTKDTKKQIGGNIGKIIFDEKNPPLKFTDNILLFANENKSSPIINSKNIDKYVVSVSLNGTVYITLPPKKINSTFEDYKKNKN